VVYGCLLVDRGGKAALVFFFLEQARETGTTRCVTLRCVTYNDGYTKGIREVNSGIWNLELGYYDFHGL
jgi:hypothetical protein